ncbi:MAG: DUF4959 domain-containing protein [Dysgonamonadaceae bacterium]|nr:DUF4959 domain-containing protein [Dysgonamonadaceae bacterium]
MKTSNLIFLASAIFTFYSCGEDSLNSPIGSKDVPRQITVTSVKDISGASIIYYNKPDDKNLKYVRAVYTTDDGVTKDATASFYTDSLLIDGFANAGTFDVALYSISTGETTSQPVHVTIHPQEPPYLVAAGNMELFPTFAGIRIATQNETESKLSFGSYRKNQSGDWEEIGMYYTIAKEIRFSVRGQEPIETEFGIRVRDKWGHWSDIKTLTTIPWFEAECSKTLFKEIVNLPSDERIQHTWSGSNTAFANLWDGQMMRNAAKCFHTRPGGTVLPQHFTMDLGQAYTLSRMLIWGRASDTNMGGSSNDWQHVWTGGYPLRIQLYGSTYTGDDPAQLVDDIDDPSWVLIGDHFLRRADGSVDPVLGNNVGTPEDQALLERGQEIEFPADAPKVRYFRFRTIMTYGGASAVMLDEFSFFGSNE